MIAMAGLGASVLLFEILLTRVLAITLFAHLAFGVIAAALAGMTVGGAIAVRDADKPAEFVSRRAQRLLVAGGVAAILATVAMCFIPMVPADVTVGERVMRSFSTRRSAVLSNPWQLNWAAISLISALSSLPFVSASYAQAVLFARAPERAGRLYAVDVAAACAGALGALLLLPLVGGPNAIGLVAVTLAVAALAFPDGSRGKLEHGGAVAVLVIGVLVLGVRPLELRHAAGFREGKVVDTLWSSLARVSLYEAGKVLPDAADIHHRYGKPWLLVDNTSRTKVAFKGDSRFTKNLSRVAMALRPEADVLIIGAGGGQEVLDAIETAAPGGRAAIDAVEVAVGMTTLMQRHYGDTQDSLFDYEEVAWHTADGRSFVQWSPRTWGVIQLKEVNLHTLAGQISSSWTPSLLFTREAFTTYLDHLDSDGLLSIVRYYRADSKAGPLRQLATLRAAANDLGLTLSDHVVNEDRKHGSGRRMGLLVSKSPFTAATLQEIRRLGKERSFKVRRAPDQPSESAEIEGLISGDADAVRGSALERGIVLTPVGDDLPFGHSSLEFGAALLGKGGEDLGAQVQTLSYRLMSVAATLFALIALGVVGLFARKAPPGRRRSALADLVVFAGLGVGFMLFEVVLIDRAGLVLGHPILGMTVVLASLLLALAGGSAASEWFVPESAPWRARVVALLVLVSILVVPFAVPALGPLAVTMSAGKLGSLMALGLAVATLPLGFLLPTALRTMAVRGDVPVSAGWAVNGAASVLGTIAAAQLVRTVGFSASATGAFLVYAVTLAVWLRGTRVAPSP